jgi:hypothetical protein
MYVQETQKLKQKPATPVLEFGTAKSNGAVPVGRIVEASVNTPASEKGLVKSIGSEHGHRMGQFAAAPATHPIAQVGSSFSKMTQKGS